jgi:Tfp pilus assembly protein FimV
MYMLQRQFLRVALLALLLSGSAHAVELGDAKVRSHIGQPLSADIELTGMENDKAPVQAGLADIDVYRGANIAMHPALGAATISVIQREGKRYLRISSPKRVDSDLVNVFFELTENGQRSVRQVTLWLKADPNPAPAPMPVAAAPAPAKGAPAAELLAAQVAAVRAAKPTPTPAPVAPVVRAPLPAPVVAPLLRAAPPAPVACIQQFNAAQISSCTALDAKNAALKNQILDLEEKVRRLTVAMQAAGATPAAAAAAAALPAPKPVPAKLTPMGAPAAKPASSTPWMFIGLASAAVFALIGALLFVMKRKRKGAKVKPVKPAKAAGPGFIARLKDRLAPSKKPEKKVGPGFIASVKNRLLPSKKEFSLTAADEPAAG